MRTEGWNLLSRELLDELYKAIVSQQAHVPVQMLIPRKRARH